MTSSSEGIALAARLLSEYPSTELLRRIFQIAFPIEAGFLPEDNVTPEQMARIIAEICANLELEQTRLFESEAQPSLETKIRVRAGGIARINGNEEFFEACAVELERSMTVRVTVVGPTFLEPEWWLARSKINNAGQLDFTEVMKKRLLGDPPLRKAEIILRNNLERYRSNLQEYVSGPSEWRKLINDMRIFSRKLFGKTGERGPRIRCFDPGFSHLPHIFDDTVLVASRATPLHKVNGGWKVDLPSQFASELETWTTIFHTYPQTQQEALVLLGEFLDILEHGT